MLCVLRGLPRRLGVADAVLVELGVWIAQHPPARQHIPEMPTVVVVHDATYFYVCVLVPHRGRVAVLKFLPVRHSPRVRPAPTVHHALRFAVGQMHAIRSAHRRKRADTAGEPARQFLHLADLPLVSRDVGNGNAERRRGVYLVHILATDEQLQLGVTRRAVRRPRCDPRLNRRPVGNDEGLARRRYQRRAQHTLQHVRHALAVLRHDSMTAHHRLAHVFRFLGALAREVMHLRAVGRCTACSRPTGKHKRAPDAVVFLVGQLCQAAELCH